MLLRVFIQEKTIGPKVLYKDLTLQIEDGEKVALIGRNGVGKTTLFRILSGEDTDFTGSLEKKRDIRIIQTKQEHFEVLDTTPLEYILSYVPDYYSLKEIIDTYPEKMGEDLHQINTYADAVSLFSERGYYQIEDMILSSLEKFRITIDQALSPMASLSGGEKRFVELVRVMYAHPDLALIDEPTNHMDYIGKERFIEWMEDAPHAVFVITHDRDVMRHVDRIIEMKDRESVSFSGNYDAYIRQNSLEAVTNIHSYEDGLKSMEKLRKQMIEAKRRKLEAKSNKGRVKARIMEERLTRQYEEVKANLEKPSLWIDEESIEKMSDTVVEKYERYKDKNIHLSIGKGKGRGQALIRVRDLSLGYGVPLFTDINFDLTHGDRVHIKGRNGVGKSSLVRAILGQVHASPVATTTYSGEILLHNTLKVGIYEQEIPGTYLSMPLGQALVELYFSKGKGLSREGLFKLLKDYLFDPIQDSDTRIENLSGGQRARFQIINMLINEPNVLVLDEPTNHLDLPSIEELENALLSFHGAILYVSHDSYFIKKLGGKEILIEDKK